MHVGESLRDSLSVSERPTYAERDGATSIADYNGRGFFYEAKRCFLR